MQSGEIRKRFLDFFEEREHAIIPSASLVPEGDSSTLFTTAGMQPLVPYLLGQKHPKGQRLANIQKCVRTGDIDEVGDNTHLTFFEMLGNWSLGTDGEGYWKKEAIEWSYTFLTSEDEGLGLDPKRLYVTVFEGNEHAPRDEESFELWKSIGVPESRIYYRGVEDNWWSPGDNGPCGPDTEMFYDVTEEGLGDLSPSEFQKADDEQKVVEVWNDVFMEYEKKGGEIVGKLKQRNVDTGAGFERLVAVLQGKKSVFETDLFEPILAEIRRNAKKSDEHASSTDSLQAERIIADHIRAAVFMIADGVEPSNTDRGYVVRRLIRRAVRYANQLTLSAEDLVKLTETVRDQYGETYSNILKNFGMAEEAIKIEEEKTRAIKLSNSQKKELKEIAIPRLEKFKEGASPEILRPIAYRIFHYSSTFGVPIVDVLEEVKSVREEEGFPGLSDEVEEKVKKTLNIFLGEEERKHQEKSRTASEGKFKGGLGDHGEETVKLHTAHHLLLAALQRVLGSEVKQRGSNITPKRLRIDFSFDRKVTDEEKEKVEQQVNEWIEQGLEVVQKEMPRDEAEKIGAEMEFGAKYPDMVSVYFIEDKDGTVISKEFCGGPHVKNTNELGHFTIKKETSSSAGVRRIKAVLE